MHRVGKVLLLGIMLLPFAAFALPPADEPVEAAADLKPTAGNAAAGKVLFKRAENGLTLSAELKGLPVGKHGIHIHEFGDCSAPDAASAGGHFNPFHHEHGAPQADMRHAGDLGNITAAESGAATLTISSELLSFAGPGSVLGRSVVVHADPDDLTSQPAGNSGGRLACGVIGVTK